MVGNGLADLIPVPLEPELDLVMMGAAACTRAGIRLLPALAEVARALGMSLPSRPAEQVRVFTGPGAGNSTDAGVLARSCWVLALITEAYRGPMVAATGPLGRFRGAAVTSDDLLGLAPPCGRGRPGDRVRDRGRLYRGPPGDDAAATAHVTQPACVAPRTGSLTSTTPPNGRWRLRRVNHARQPEDANCQPPAY